MKFNPDKLETTFIEPMTPYGPLENRKYTLTHSDETGMMFLDIADVYVYEAIDQELRDELLGEWSIVDKNKETYKIVFNAFVGNGDYFTAYMRYNAFKYHMDIALKSIVYGDRDLFKTYPALYDTPIYVKFNSSFPMFNTTEFYGYARSYIIE